MSKVWLIVKSGAREAWFLSNQFLKEDFRDFLAKKIIDNLIIYLIYTLLVLSVSYSAFHLISDIVKEFTKVSKAEDFPFILKFSEELFLYFLPVFILFGLLNYYDLKWKRLINKTNDPNPKAQNYLDLSKKLFFSSLLSYTSLKIIEKVFFDYEKIVQKEQFIYIGVFFLILSIFVILQHGKDD